MTNRLAVTSIMATWTLAGACTAAPEPTSPPPTSPSAIIDKAPYLCGLVPEQSFRRVTGVTFPLKPRWNGRQEQYGGCSAFAVGREPPLAIEWAWGNGRKHLRQLQESFSDDPHRDLPKELGEGIAVIWAKPDESRKPNSVFAIFQCDDRRLWMSIYFAAVVRGRDALQDMVDLMRIAQRRFGVVHHCTPDG
jgi:hypothetical protein